MGATWEIVDVPTDMVQISCGANMLLWGVSSDGKTWIIQNPTRSNPQGTGFVAIQQAENNDCNVAAGQTGEVWKVTKSGSIFRRQGIASLNPSGDSWSEIDGNLKQVSVGNWDTWGVTKFHEVVRRSGVSR
jgi:tectonin beta-propeller repeat-containing protein 1